MKVGLRIDVDTLRGTQLGVPSLCNVLADQGILATFFVSVGPDNMGRHIRRLLRPAFFLKMLRTRSANLYGWDILLRGTLWPGPVIGEKLGPVIQAAAAEGHEVGFHAWDHHAWQTRLERMDARAIYDSLQKGMQLLTAILGHAPTCSAAPAWKITDCALLQKLQFPLQYNSDCRGESIFFPVVGNNQLPQPQIPTTLPTYDEVIGRNGISDVNYNDFLLSLIKPGQLNVLTIHAEVEGIARRKMFESFVKKARRQGICFVPLATLVQDCPVTAKAAIMPREMPGREGWLAWQIPLA